MQMRKSVSRVLVAIVFLIIAAAGYSCSPGRYLRTEKASPKELSGAYTLILYGGNYMNDLETFAVLAQEGTGYSFSVFAPDFDYRVIKHVPAGAAFERANKFVGSHPDFWKVSMAGIIDNAGETIGYEVKPLYYPHVFGRSDLFDLYYKKSDGKVIVYIRTNPAFLNPEPLIGRRPAVHR